MKFFSTEFLEARVGSAKQDGRSRQLQDVGPFGFAAPSATLGGAAEKHFGRDSEHLVLKQAGCRLRSKVLFDRQK